MTDADPLLATILAHPEDDLPRLVYADWLEERGEHERAEFIRVQCELAKSPHCKTTVNYPPNYIYDRAKLWNCERCLLMFRERKLMDASDGDNLRSWLGNLGGYKPFADPTGCGWDSGQIRVTLRRGFVESVRLPLAAFMGGEDCRCVLQGGEPWESCHACAGTGRTEGIAAALFASQPVTRVNLAGVEPDNDGDDPPTWSWWKGDVPGALPKELFNLLPGDAVVDMGAWRKTYDSRELAIAALSDAAVAYGRSLAKLPAMEPKVAS